MAVISSGQRVLVDLNDAKALQLFLSSSQPNTQVYNQTTGGYTPDWTSSKPVITPELYIAGTNTNILSQAKSITWFDGGSQISSGTNYTLGTGNQTLTVNTNRVIPIDDALSFDSSTTKVSTAALFASAPSALTIIAKFRMVATPSNYNTIAELGVAGGTTGFYLETVQGTPEVLFGGAVTSGGNAFSGAANEARSGALSLNQFHTAAIVVTSSNLIAYVDGAQVGSVSGTYDLTKAEQALGIGGARGYFNGDVAYVGVFNTAVQPEFIAQYSTNDLKGTEPGLVNYYNLVKASGTTVTDSVGGKNGTISGTFTLPSAATIHKRTLMCQVVYTDPTVNTDLNVTATIDIFRQYTGATGDQGAPVAMATLSNDTAVITTANDGTGGSYGAPNTQSTLTIYLGGTDVTNLYTISQARTNVTVTEATSSNVATVTAMSADTGSVVFTATRSGYPTLTKTFSLAKSKMGVVGQTPTSYWLTSSVSHIAEADDGSYTPTTVTFGAESQSGTSAAAAYAGRFIISESTDGNSFTTKYTSGANESSKVYTPSAGIAAIRVDMYQAGGTSVKLDTQTIPVVNDGKNSVMVSAWTPTGNVIRNAGNTVTAEADLYNGGNPVTGSNYRWVKGNGSATSVIAGAGYEDLDLGKRNIASGTATPYVRTSFTGLDNNVSVLGYTIDPTLVKGTIRFSCDITVKGVTTSASGTPAMYFQFYTQDSGGTQLWSSTSGGTSSISLTDGSYHMSGVYGTAYTNTITSASMQIRANYITSGTVTVTNFKMEAGSLETPWLPSYTDSTVDQTDSTLYGRNLLQNTSNFTNTTNWNTSSTAFAITTNASNNLSIKKVQATDAQHLWAPITLNLVSGQKYTLTVTGRINGWDGTSQKWGSFATSDATGGAFYDSFSITNLPTDGTIGTGRVTFTSSQSGVRTLAMSTTGIQNNLELEIQSIKLEALPYGTDYSPAPEDNAASYPTNAAGVNKWIFRYYSGSATSDKLYGYADISSLTPTYQTLLTDQANIQQNVADYYVGYYKTAVYVSTAKTINFASNVDDTLNVLVNGIQQFSQIGTNGGATATIPLNLQAGWNTVELIDQEVTGADGIWNTPVLSSLVDEMNANYALDFGPLKGNYGITGYNTSSMIVNTNAVTDTDMFMCVVTYRGSTYKDSVTIDDITDPIVVVINGLDMFKNGQGTNTYTASLYQNGAQIDPDGTIYTYQWYVYNSDGSLDATFGGSGVKTGQTITVAYTDINVSGSLQCQVYK